MAFPILQTKLHIPSLRSQLVSRTRLLQRLNEGLNRKLTLVSAQAGVGKTTLVSEWLGQLDLAAAWLSLEEADSEPTRFWLYLIAALQTISPELGRTARTLLETSTAPAFETLLTTLINDIVTAPERCILVLDDYHFISDLAIHQGLNFLLDHMPFQLHLVLLTRDDPPLPLARLRVRQTMTELRARDLRFTGEEARCFLIEAMGLALQPAAAETLVRRTEGWVAGLQMAALSMQQVPEADAFIEEFAGDDRYVVDYLIGEVLERQPPEVEEFLLQTSILPRFTAELCNAVTSGTHGREMLTRLEASNLFLTALDNHRQWFRYHHLFAELLRYRLAQEKDEIAIQLLHQRAAGWYARCDLLDEALNHWLAAKEYDHAADLVESNILNLMRQGQVRKLQAWFNLLPDAIIRARPFLCTYHAWVLLLMGQTAVMETRMLDAEYAAQAAAGLSPAERDELSTHILAMRAYIARRNGQVEEALQLLQQAADALSQENQIFRNVVQYNLGFTHLLAGQIRPAIYFLQQARADAQRLRNLYTATSSATDLATAYIAQGRLRDAAKLYEEEIAAGLARNYGQPFPLTGFAYAGLGEILYERNLLPAAAENLAQAIQLGEALAEVSMVFNGLTPLGLIEAAQGDYAAAETLWQRAESLAQQMGDATRAMYVATCRIRAWLHRYVHTRQAADLTPAVQWAERYQTARPKLSTYQACFCELTLAWVEFAQNQLEQAHTRLAALSAAAASADWHNNLIKILALQALVMDAQGKLTSALDTLQSAFALATPEGFVRSFVEYGAPMRQLLQHAAAANIAPVYVTQLLAAFPPNATPSLPATSREPLNPTPQAPSPELQDASLQLIEGLNERERQILRMMAVRRSNQQIADELYLSINTVKWHARNIYSKLGVSNRGEAVDRARELAIF